MAKTIKDLAYEDKINEESLRNDAIEWIYQLKQMNYDGVLNDTKPIIDWIKMFFVLGEDSEGRLYKM